MVNYFITFPIVRKTPFFRFGSTKIEHAISVYGGSESFVEVYGGKRAFRRINVGKCGQTVRNSVKKGKGALRLP